MKDKKKKELTEFEKAMEAYKYEIAQELGIEDRLKTAGWENLTARECGSIGGKMGGKIGGEMVKRMIAKEKARLRRT